MSSENVRNLVMTTEAQKKLEAFINDQEDMGEFLVALGLISDDEYAAGIHKMEDFLVKVSADPAYAEKEEKELEETGDIVDAQA